MSFEQQLISWRRELHQNPELSLQEVATTARIRDWLQSGGLTLLPYDLKTGLVAEVGSGDIYFLPAIFLEKRGFALLF